MNANTATTAGPEVLAATPDSVVLLAKQYSNTMGKPIECVLYVSRALYLKAISAWLDQESEYSAQYNDMDIGVGTIVWTDLTRRPGVATEAYDAAGFIVDERG
jgi:hypothetical protein